MNQAEIDGVAYPALDEQGYFRGWQINGDRIRGGTCLVHIVPGRITRAVQLGGALYPVEAEVAALPLSQEADWQYRSTTTFYPNAFLSLD